METRDGAFCYLSVLESGPRGILAHSSLGESKNWILQHRRCATNSSGFYTFTLHFKLLLGSERKWREKRRILRPISSLSWSLTFTYTQDQAGKLRGRKCIKSESQVN